MWIITVRFGSSPKVTLSSQLPQIMSSETSKGSIETRKQHYECNMAVEIHSFFLFVSGRLGLVEVFTFI